MIELINVKTGRQFLLEPQNATRTYSRPSYGANFTDYDMSGFDECFPTIAPSRYRSLGDRDRQHNFDFPDHGELWSRPWAFQIDDDEIIFSIHGVNAQYVFEKRVKLYKNTLLQFYSVRNLSKEPFSFLWSPHPLLSVRPGTKLLLPESVDCVFLNWASDETFGKHGDVVSWPFLSTSYKHIDYSEVQEKSLGQAVKCFTDRLSRGYAEVCDTKTNESLILEFDPRENPYLGIWLCYGGWPVDRREKHLTVALEPCNGRPDSLEEAVLRKECSKIKPFGKKSWSLGLSLWRKGTSP